MSSPILDGKLARQFVLGGAALFTLRSKLTQTRFTYRVRRPDEQHPFAVQVLNGPDNGKNYRTIGHIFPNMEFHYSHTSGMMTTAKSIQAFGWTWYHFLSKEKLPSTLEFWHEGRCCKCSRPLTDPESIARGMGPECFRRV